MQYGLRRDRGSFESYVSLIDPTKIEILNHITTITGAKIILTTPWRIPEICKHPIVNVLKKAGLTGDIIGGTETIPSRPCEPLPRGREVEADILKRELNIEHVVILDSDRDMKRHTRRKPYLHRSRVVLVQRLRGLTWGELGEIRRLWGI